MSVPTLPWSAPPTADQFRAFEGALVGPPDFTIQLGKYTWKVDIQLLANKSGFFKKVLEGPEWKENSDHAIELHDDDPSTFARILQYVYYSVYLYDLNIEPQEQTVPTTNWSSINGLSLSTILNGGQLRNPSGKQDSTLTVKEIEHCQEVHEARSEACIDVLVYLLADKYLMPNLKRHAIQRFCGNATTCHRIVESLSDHIEEMDAMFRKDALACCIASMYSEMRYGKGGEENRRIVQRWLVGDMALCVMVMDAMNALLKMEKPVKCEDCNRWGPPINISSGEWM